MPTSPAIDAVFTKCPPCFCAIRRGTNASTPWRTPQKFDAHRELPVGVRALRDRAEERDAGVVADDVGRAEVPRTSRRRAPRPGRARRRRCGTVSTSAPRARCSSAARSRAACVEVGEHELRAARRERARHRRADAAGAAGDDRHAPLERVHPRASRARFGSARGPDIVGPRACRARFSSRSGSRSASATRCGARPRAPARGPSRRRAVDGDPAAVEVAFFSGGSLPVRTRELVLALRDAPGLRWLHSFAAGVDHPWFQSLLARGMRLTNSPGASAVPIAHTVMLYLLALSRDLPGLAARPGGRALEPARRRGSVRASRSRVLGLGPIGVEVARLARRVRDARHRLAPHAGRRRAVRDARRWRGSTALLPELDWLVLALPLTRRDAAHARRARASRSCRSTRAS